MKLALMLRAWISEVDEERIMEKYGVAPGGVRAKNRNADWLLYSAQELCRLEDIDQEEELERLRRRMRHGIKEELLPLVKFDQIGRVRARKLMEHGIDEVRFEKLKKLIGDSTARTLKEQVGEENIFDRENIMDYFDE
jgi:helicase